MVVSEVEISVGFMDNRSEIEVVLFPCQRLFQVNSRPASDLQSESERGSVCDQ
jgi:hypothetical protein